MSLQINASNSNIEYPQKSKPSSNCTHSRPNNKFREPQAETLTEKQAILHSPITRLTKNKNPKTKKSTAQQAQSVSFVQAKIGSSIVLQNEKT